MRLSPIPSEANYRGWLTELDQKLHLIFERTKIQDWVPDDKEGENSAMDIWRWRKFCNECNNRRKASCLDQEANLKWKESEEIWSRNSSSRTHPFSCKSHPLTPHLQKQTGLKRNHKLERELNLLLMIVVISSLSTFLDLRYALYTVHILFIYLSFLLIWLTPNYFFWMRKDFKKE